MTSLVLWVLAAVFNACSDTMAHHFSTSVFKWWDPRFWNAETSWKEAPYLKYTKYRVDGWHLAKTAMIICVALACALHQPHFSWYWELGIAGILWNSTFNLFYNHILRRL